MPRIELARRSNGQNGRLPDIDADRHVCWRAILKPPGDSVYSVYGRISAGLKVAPGVYADSIVVVVSY